MGRRRKWAAVIAVACLVVLTGCQERISSSSSPPKVTVPRDQADLVGRWYGANGDVLPDGSNASGGILVAVSAAGSSTCGRDHVTVVLTLSWPPGHRLDWNSDGRRDAYHVYLRDTAGATLLTDGSSDLDTDLPSRAEDTGIHREGNKIYAVVSKPAAVWVQRADGHIERWARLVQRADGHIERWARLKPTSGCA